MMEEIVPSSRQKFQDHRLVVFVLEILLRHDEEVAVLEGLMVANRSP
jgi:hypothetical protein